MKSIIKTPVDIYKILLISLMFDAYSIFYIQTFPVTLFTIFSILFIGKNIIQRGRNLLCIHKRNMLLVLLLIYLFINFLFFNCQHITSFMQSVYFIVLCLLAFRREKREKFNSYLELFQHLMTIMSIYGIYQFFGRLIKLPFTDLVIPGHMVSGFNWTNTINFFGISFYRSNAVFREPSFFGQMLAISIILYVPIIINKEKSIKKYILPMLLQVIALFLTFSGTGFFIFGIALILYFLLTPKTKSIWTRLLLFIFFGGIFISYILFNTPIGDYLLLRMNELFVYSKNASSGFVRFRSWIYVVKEAWDKNCLFGSGIGTGADYVSKFAIQYYGMSLNGFAKVATELGVLGLGLWGSYLLTFLKKSGKTVIDNKYLILACSMIPFIFMHETFSSNIFWTFLMLLNIKFDDVLYRGNNYGKNSDYNNYL